VAGEGVGADGVTDHVRPQLGLCSVTFRSLPAAEVVRLSVAAGLDCVEWGADVHAPPSDPSALATVRTLTRDAGLRVASYGAYWRAGVHPLAQLRPVLSAAAALGAPRVRVWAGEVGTAQATADIWRDVARALRQAGDLALDHGLQLGLEFHGRTLTDTVESTVRLLELVDHAAVAPYWQPRLDDPPDVAVEGLRVLLDQVAAVHVFSWWPRDRRLPLADRADLWQPVLAELLARKPGTDLLLEFVPGDDPAVLAREAQTLRRWVRQATEGVRRT
jgi:sugar phosphate isomerase/epimerase